MLENPRSPRVRAVAKLTKRSARTDTGLFLLEGPQAVREALSYRPDAIVELFATPTGWDKHPDLRAAATEHGVEVEFVTEYVLAAMADTVTPQGVIAVARQIPIDFFILTRRSSSENASDIKFLPVIAGSSPF